MFATVSAEVSEEETSENLDYEVHNNRPFNL